MSSKSDAYSYANSVIAGRRTADFERFDNVIFELEQNCPEAIKVFNELNDIQSRVVKSVFSGEDNLAELQERQQALTKQLDEILINNNYGKDYLEVKYVCPLCSDTGVKNGDYCKCFKALVNEYNFNELCGKSQVEKCSFDNFSLNYYPETENDMGVSPKKKMSEILNYCKNYANCFSKKSNSVLMCGKTGLGKTHLSLAIAEQVAKSGYNVIYGSAQNLLRQAEKEHFSGEDETINSLLTCDLLVLDDLGTEFESKFNTSQVYNIINTRLNFSFPTIISTNLSGNELQERYAQRVVSRLIGDYDCLMFVGNDIRQLKNKM